MCFLLFRAISGGERRDETIGKQFLCFSLSRSLSLSARHTISVRNYSYAMCVVAFVLLSGNQTQMISEIQLSQFLENEQQLIFVPFVSYEILLRSHAN